MQVRVGSRAEVRVESSSVCLRTQEGGGYAVLHSTRGCDAGFWLQSIARSCRSGPGWRGAAASPKRIVRDGENFVLPDGTRVAADEKGGFRLPNGEYVAVLADGLLLPNGRRCAPDDAGGFVCP
jgi:hypothetical protein